MVVKQGFFFASPIFYPLIISLPSTSVLFFSLMPRGLLASHSAEAAGGTAWILSEDFAEEFLRVRKGGERLKRRELEEMDMRERKRITCTWMHAPGCLLARMQDRIYPRYWPFNRKREKERGKKQLIRVASISGAERGARVKSSRGVNSVTEKLIDKQTGWR